MALKKMAKALNKSVADNKAYIKLKEPTADSFNNNSKNINKIKPTHTHNVVDYYGRIG